MTTGHVRQRGGSWEVRLSAGTHPSTGRRRVLTRTVRGSRAAAELILWQLQVLDAEERGLDPPAGPREVEPAGPREVEPPGRTRWPLAPLLDAAPGLTLAQLERAGGLAAGTGRRWAAHGLTDEAADRVTIGLGLHPAMVWDW